MLYGRRISVGLLAADSVAEAGIGFIQIPVLDDPHVLVVPDRLVLDGVTDPERQLAEADSALLGQSIEFIFGTQHASRVEAWYDEMLPRHRIVAHCRSFELAVALVRAGAGICLAPALSTIVGTSAPDGVKLYRVNAPSRRIVALVPSQYRRLEPYSSLLDTLQDCGRATRLPDILPTPPFLDRPATP
jgi:DNA-binding transcriptional LysR family regulator